MLTEFNKLKIKPICYKYKTVNDIFSIILDIGRLTDKNQNAQKLNVSNETINNYS